MNSLKAFQPLERRWKRVNPLTFHRKVNAQGPARFNLLDQPVQEIGGDSRDFSVTPRPSHGLQRRRAISPEDARVSR